MTDTTPPIEPEQPAPPPPNPYQSGAAQAAPNPYEGGAGQAPPNPYQAGPNPYQAGYAPVVPKTLSLISMIAGIVGCVFFGWFGLASIAALILGYMGKKREPLAKGFWLTGIITGWVGIGFMILAIGMLVLFTLLPIMLSAGSLGY